ncbi:hypothetical protein [Rhodothermus marinus]|uniref:hypothetical protein n=1 Tax=Rhodothermus marinus TaxID=29549 RepID=UPI0006D27F40|nr:hypothetical protein [Rhodothermus marinus]
MVVRNVTEGAKRKVESITTELEPDLLYPLLRGRDVRRWYAQPSLHILMVQDPKTRRGIDEQVLQQRYPKTWAYLKRFEAVLRERKSQMIRRLMESGPFYSIFGIGDYTFAPWKVVWRGEVATSLVAAVIGKNGEKNCSSRPDCLFGCV